MVKNENDKTDIYLNIKVIVTLLTRVTVVYYFKSHSGDVLLFIKGQRSKVSWCSLHHGEAAAEDRQVRMRKSWFRLMKVKLHPHVSC